MANPWEMDWGTPQGGGVQIKSADPRLPTELAKARTDLARAGVDLEKTRLETDAQRQKLAKQSGSKTPAEIEDARKEIENVIAKAAQAKDLSHRGFATGFGSNIAANLWPGGSSAQDVRGLLDVIGSNTAFTRLQKMRDESPTGGALGNVTERELELLKSTVASLDPAQSDEQFRRSMDDVVAAYQRVLGRLPGAPKTAAPPPTGNIAAGTIIRNPKTGERRQWNGRAWVEAR